MASFAQTIIAGNLGGDVETRYMTNGDAVANFSVAVTESWKDKNSGEKKESTTWYRCVAYRKTAEVCGQYLKKGSSVLVVGKMQEREWQDKEQQKRTSWELRVETMQILGKREGQGADSTGYQPAPARSAPSKQAGGSGGAPGGFDSFEDDIPFRQLGAGGLWRVL